MNAFEQLKADLSKLRDEAKVQAHLGAMEAQKEWNELETKWAHFASQARLHESGSDIKSTLQTLGNELRSAYEHLKKAL
ncbi:MAG: hypothetical protein AB7G25_02060 [Sphingomonadaceae bacterium]